ncbi:MAG: hypothetical protein KGN39_02500 [Betaproteobacteria bacterium]|nr:hypothetical protein [Betaproteobacteria bacterium]
MAVISHFVNSEEQGWYYTFLSLAALYTLADLGLSIVLVPLFAKHFSATQLLRGGRLKGEGGLFLGRLLGRTVRWYITLAAGFVALVLPGGALYFSQLSSDFQSWLVPWSCVVAAGAGILLLIPFLAFVEGSGHIRALSIMRLQQTLLGACGCWFMLVKGEELWAAVMMPTATVVVPVLWLLGRWYGLLGLAWHYPGREINWRQDILPLQWRLGVSWACAYFTTQIYTPILMHTQGAVVAGQMGLSLAIMTMVGFLGQSFLSRRVPMMAQAAARRDFVALDGVFRRDFLFFSVSYIAAGLGLVVLKLGLSGTIYANRVLPFWQLVGLLGIVFVNQVVGVLGTYLRSFLYEPLTKVNLIGTLVAVPAAVAAATYSSAAVIGALLAVALLINFPWACAIWWRERRRWRGEQG